MKSDYQALEEYYKECGRAEECPKDQAVNQNLRDKLGSDGNVPENPD